MSMEPHPTLINNQISYINAKRKHTHSFFFYWLKQQKKEKKTQPKINNKSHLFIHNTCTICLGCFSWFGNSCLTIYRKIRYVFPCLVIFSTVFLCILFFVLHGFSLKFSYGLSKSLSVVVYARVCISILGSKKTAKKENRNLPCLVKP